MKCTIKTTTLILIVLLYSCNESLKDSSENNIYQEGINKLEYNNPGLLVDLDVGFKSVPMPMDFDGDGDLDLVVSESGAYVEAGLFYFENLSGNVEMPIFRHGEKVSIDRFPLGLNWDCYEASEANGESHIIIADKHNHNLLLYRNFPKNIYRKKIELPLNLSDKSIPESRVSRWKMLDFDADGKTDLAGVLESRDRSGCHLLIFKNKGTNEKPIFSKPHEIKTQKGVSIIKGFSLNPLLADFDNDGDLDFIEIDSFGHFIYYENTGTPSHYKFSVGRKITDHERNPLQMVSFHGGAVKATAFDWDKDGFVDIIAGDEDGKVSFIKNTGRIIDGVPEFLPPRFFQQEAKFVDLGALATPRVFDWDGDGLDDIVSGNGLGNIVFVKNLGGYPPKWDAPKLLEVDGVPIRLIAAEALPNTEEPHWGYTTIDVGDWDMDGLRDIMANDHNGNIVWFKNIGTRTNPKLSNPQAIEVEWEGEPQKPAWTPGVSKGKELLAPWRTSPYIMDFNNDGMNDLVMLDYQGYLVTYFRQKDKNGQLLLLPPQRNFVYPDGNPVRLNQKEQKNSGRIKFAFADWDGDGLEDLLFTSSPAIDWMKNMGMNEGKTVLQYMGRVVSRTLMGHTGGPTVSDFNKDGIPDLLVGTETGVLYYWQRSSFEITTTMTTTGKQTPANYKYFKR